jgi:hypothetical protein
VACVEYNIGKIQVNRYKDNNVPLDPHDRKGNGQEVGKSAQYRLSCVSMKMKHNQRDLTLKMEIINSRADLASFVGRCTKKEAICLT